MSSIQTIAAGHRLPTVRLKRLEEGHVKDILTDELFGKERVLVLGFPGAFTPICEGVHLPSYLEKLDDIRAKGIGSVIAITANDPWVTAVWENHMGCADQIPIYAEGNIEFARALGLTFEAQDVGIGVRSHRYSMVVKNGVVMTLNVDKGMEVCRVTSAAQTVDEI